MKIFNNQFKICRCLSLLLIIVIILISISAEHVMAADPWATIEGGTNGIQDSKVMLDTIVQKGTHSSADDNVTRYRTKYYRMATEKYVKEEKFTEGDNADIEYKYVPFTFGKVEDDGTTKYVEYIIQQKDFMSAAAKLGITGDYIVEHSSAVVYLNNVFETFNKNGVIDNYVWGYQEMLAEESWSSATVNYLKGYYNFKYIISNSTVFNVKVIAVDTDGNVLDNDLLGYAKHAIYDEVIPPYTLKDDPIVKNGVTYDYQHWKYTYKDRESEDTKTLGNYSGKKVSFNAPDAYPNSTLTVKMVYKKEKDVITTTPTPTPIVTTPTPTPIVTTPTPNPSVTPVPTATPFPTVAPVVAPTEAPPKKLTIDSPSPYGVINGDKYDSSYFTSEDGIPTTESQYVYVKSKDYLLGYNLVNRTGKAIFYVPVTMHTMLTYKSATPGGGTTVTKEHKYKQIIKVERAYSYWETVNLDYYYVDSANVYNYSLPDGSVNLSTNKSYLNIPKLYTSHSSLLTDHINVPPQVSAGIDIWDTPITTNATTMPNVVTKDLSYYALTMTDQLIVNNDYIAFDGTVVMSNATATKIAPTPNPSKMVQRSTLSNNKMLFTENRVIDAGKNNGIFSSTGNVLYQLDGQSVTTSRTSMSYSIDVNKVTIHTPVICSPIVSADNDKWTQLISPVKDAVQIVLDPDTSLNDFTVTISNTLKHSNRLGYYTRDFSRSLIDPDYTSYIARSNGFVRNEMKLPFDVYIDFATDGVKENDKFIKAGTWIVLGRDTVRFYVPMWAQEGTYTAQFRTVAVNGTDKLSLAEITRNSSINNYIATSTKTIQISGRIYGLKLYDISDYPNWENVFRQKSNGLLKLFEGAADGTRFDTKFNSSYAYYYAVGTKDQYGNSLGRYNKYTIPLVNGCHPQYKNLGVLKTGYAVRFFLDTTGEMYSSGCKIKITPTFYYVDADGKNRKLVDLYYSGEIDNKYYPLLKVGAGKDLVNIQSGITGNIYSGIPDDEIINTAKVLNTTYSKISQQRSNMYSFFVIKILKSFRTFIGLDYASKIALLSSFNDVKTETGQTEVSLSKYMQRWYGTYKLPTDVHVVASGYDVYDYLKKHGIDYSENFWLKGGYIIVNFNIVTIDENGKERLSYINAKNYLNNNNCSMWVTEGAIVSKKDSKGISFDLRAGDSIFYYTDKKYSDDYEGRLY